MDTKSKLCERVISHSTTCCI